MIRLIHTVNANLAFFVGLGNPIRFRSLLQANVQAFAMRLTEFLKALAGCGKGCKLD
jgi:hypothetical protein